MDSIDHLAEHAVRAGMTSLGISIHAPMPFGEQSCPQEKLNGFLTAVHDANKKFSKEGLRIYAGAEWDVLSTIPHDAHSDGSISLASFDYVIGSVHHITVENPQAENLMRISGIQSELIDSFKYRHFPVDESHQSSKHMVNGYFGGNADQAIRHYYVQYKAIADNPYVKIVGHFDLPLKFCTMYGFLDQEYHVFSENSKAFQEATNEAMQLLVRAGKIFEVNIRTWMGGVPAPSQHRTWEWLRRLHALGGKVTVSSDAHRASEVSRHFSTAVELIRRSGFEEIWVLEETARDNEHVLGFSAKNLSLPAGR